MIFYNYILCALQNVDEGNDRFPAIVGPVRLPVYWFGQHTTAVSHFRLDWTVVPAAGDIIIQLQGNGTGWLFLSFETATLSDVILGGFDASTGQAYVYVRNKLDWLRLSIGKL